MSDSRLDIEREKYCEWLDRQRSIRQDYCYRDCDEHNNKCPYYDEETETWDYDLCFEESGGWE